jgi:serine/threonine protein kinase
MMENYELVRILGRGGEGTVWLVTRIDSKQQFVMKKRTFTDLANANRGLQEAMALCRFQSEYVIKSEEVFLDLEMMDGVQLYHICLVMQYCPGGDLCSRVMALESGTSALDSRVCTKRAQYTCQHTHTHTHSLSLSLSLSLSIDRSVE